MHVEDIIRKMDNTRIMELAKVIVDELSNRSNELSPFSYKANYAGYQTRLDFIQLNDKKRRLQ
jgi:hypothetical protein